MPLENFQLNILNRFSRGENLIAYDEQHRCFREIGLWERITRFVKSIWDDSAWQDCRLEHVVTAIANHWQELDLPASRDQLLTHIDELARRARRPQQMREIVGLLHVIAQGAGVAARNPLPHPPEASSVPPSHSRVPSLDSSTQFSNRQSSSVSEPSSPTSAVDLSLSETSPSSTSDLTDLQPPFLESSDPLKQQDLSSPSSPTLSPRSSTTSFDPMAHIATSPPHSKILTCEEGPYWSDGSPGVGVFGRHNGCHLATILGVFYLNGVLAERDPKGNALVQLLNQHVAQPLQQKALVGTPNFRPILESLELSRGEQEDASYVAHLLSERSTLFNFYELFAEDSSQIQDLAQFIKSASLDHQLSQNDHIKPALFSLPENRNGDKVRLTAIPQTVEYSGQVRQIVGFTTRKGNLAGGHWKAYTILPDGKLLEHNPQFPKAGQGKRSAVEIMEELEQIKQRVKAHNLQSSSLLGFYYDPEEEKFIICEATLIKAEQWKETVRFFEAHNDSYPLNDNQEHVELLQAMAKVNRELTADEVSLAKGIVEGDGDLTAFTGYTGLRFINGALEIDQQALSRVPADLAPDSPYHNRDWARRQAEETLEHLKKNLRHIALAPIAS